MRRIRFVGVRFVLFGIVFVGVAGLVTFWLWNLVMPPVFGLHAISFWQALGLLVLSRILFGRFGGWGHRMLGARFARGWQLLTPEERERFRSAMRARWEGRFGEGESQQ